MSCRMGLSALELINIVSSSDSWRPRAEDARHYFLLTSATPRAAIRPPTTIEINIGSSNNVAENKTPNAGTKLVKIAVRDGPTV